MNPASLDRIALRAVRDDDAAFLGELFATTRAAELAVLPWGDEQKRAFVAMQHRAQREHYAAQFPRADHHIIERDGEPIGRLYVDRGPEEIRVVDIALLPVARGLGIGTRLLEQLLDEAAAARTPVRLTVSPQNPARRLYARLGFRSTGGDALHEAMEWMPAGRR